MTNEETIRWLIDSPFYHKDHEPFNKAIKALEQPEIIRCGECKYWDGKVQGGFYYFEHCSLHNIGTIQDDFCSYAERKENG